MANWIDDPQNREEVEKVTQELKLPVWKPNYKGKFRDFWNECWDKIEDNFLKLKGSNDSKEPIIPIKQNAFNKPFGVIEDTILEGNKFTQMTGKDFGGILNTPGLKTSGKAYWDNNTRKLYICKNNNNDISPSTNNYIPFDSASLLERLENLYKNFEQSGNWYYKQISSNFYILFAWILNVPAGESYYDLPISTISEHTNSVVLATQTSTTAIKPITCYIRDRKLYINNKNTTVDNYSIFAIVQI